MSGSELGQDPATLGMRVEERPEAAGHLPRLATAHPGEVPLAGHIRRWCHPPRSQFGRLQVDRLVPVHESLPRSTRIAAS